MCYISKDVKVMTMKMLMVGGMRWSVGWGVWRQGSVNRMPLIARVTNKWKVAHACLAASPS